MRKEENNMTSQNKHKNSFFKKRWVYPAVYLVAAALIISSIVWYQQSGVKLGKGNTEQNKNGLVGVKNSDNPALEVSKGLENIKLPVSDQSNAKIETQYYDEKASEAKQESAILVYGSSYYLNKGIDIVQNDKKSFNVVAALSGTVSKVSNDSLIGNVIEIKHEDGVTTQYQSVKDFKVAEGDRVSQGQTLATAGESLLNKKAGVHVHFEIRKDGVAVNPENYINKNVASIKVDQASSATLKDENADNSTETSSDATEDETTQQSSDKGTN